MKVYYPTKKTVEIQMNLAQLDALLAALDSVCMAGGPAYANCRSLEKSLLNALSKSQENSGRIK